MTSKITIHEIKDTGVKVGIRKVSPNTLNDFQKWFDANDKEPQPPTNPVDYGDGKIVNEPNLSDPDYKKLVQERQRRLIFGTQNLMIDRGVVYELTEDDKKAVSEYRTYWQETYQQELEVSDKVAFIRYIAIGTPEDLNELATIISRRTMPTEGAISEQLKSL